MKYYLRIAVTLLLALVWHQQGLGLPNLWTLDHADQLRIDVEIDAGYLLFNGEGKDARQQLIDAKGGKFEGGKSGVDPAQAFITRWKCKAGDRIRVPLYGTYPYSWEKADGTVVERGMTHETDLLVLEAEVAGEYVLKAGPAGVRYMAFADVYGSTNGTPLELQQVEQWGSVKWETFRRAFYGCENMRISNGAGKPDLSKVEDMVFAFEKCKQFNSPIADWDVSHVTDMRSMFSGCSAFNQPLEKWDVSKVLNMNNMFYGCSAFNQPLGGWTLSALVYDNDSSHNLGLSGSGLSVENYSATLAGWAVKKGQLKDGIRVDGRGFYFDERGKAARQQLIDEKGWVFEGDREATVSTPGVEIVDAPSQLYVGDTYTFKARVVPAEASQEVTWSVKEGNERGPSRAMC